MMEYLTISGLLLTIIALVIAAWQSHSAKKHTSELQKIKESMSTRYLGEYPDFIPQISSLMSTAKQEVSIVNSVATTGIFNNRSAWLEYRRVIEELLNDEKNVNIMMLNKVRRQQFEDEQFSYTPETWGKWKSSLETKRKIETFLKHNYPNVTQEQLTKDIFVEILDEVHTNTIRQSFMAANIMEIDEHIPVNLWVVDNQHAIFTMPVTINGYSDKGFITSDARLIESFKGIIHRYQSKNESNPPIKQSTLQNSGYC